MKPDIPDCINIFTTDAVRQHVKAIQASMEESAQDCFTKSEVEHLRVVVRLTVELHHYFQITCGHSFCLSYTCESIFSGIDSYRSLTHAYGVLVGAVGSRIDWSTVSVLELKVPFSSMFEAFEKEKSFESKCRFLLDLYKLMIVFAGISFSDD
ncbi:MAG: hypothetical protein ACYDA9_02300 [Terriglobia bacterium]